MFARIIFVNHSFHLLRRLAIGVAELFQCLRDVGLLIDTSTLSTKYIVFFFGRSTLPFVHNTTGFFIHRGFLVVVWRCEVDFHICIDDADGLVVILRFDFENINVVLPVVGLDADSIPYMQARKIPQLYLQNGLGVRQIDEFREMRLQFNVVVILAFLQVGHQADGTRATRLKELEHFKHPPGHVTVAYEIA